MSDMNQGDWDRQYQRTELLWSAEPNQFVKRYLAALRPGTAIDLGAGEGRNAVWLAKRGWSVSAVDFSEVALDKGRELAANNAVAVDFVHHDVTTFRPEGHVDLWLLSYLQLAEPTRSQTLSRVANWVAPGATVFVVAHDTSNVEHGYGGPPDAAVCYDLDQTVEAFSALEILEATVAERHVQTADGPRTALDTVVMARRPPVGTR